MCVIQTLTWMETEHSIYNTVTTNLEKADPCKTRNGLQCANLPNVIALTCTESTHKANTTSHHTVHFRTLIYRVEWHFQWIVKHSTTISKLLLWSGYASKIKAHWDFVRFRWKYKLFSSQFTVLFVNTKSHSKTAAVCSKLFAKLLVTYQCGHMASPKL